MKLQSQPDNTVSVFTRPRRWHWIAGRFTSSPINHFGAPDKDFEKPSCSHESNKILALAQTLLARRQYARFAQTLPQESTRRSTGIPEREPAI